MIPRLEPITVTVRQPNRRRWELYAREVAGTATPAERAEMDALCALLEDN